ncbi:Xanthine phosphoribosyltransferase [Megasphaera sp. NM10]|nr:Xanthine phosphoribosyltransferase [Megasphaera sp. NM10]
MEELKQRILQDGLVIDNRILKIDNFLNQQIDTNLINHVGQEFARRFKDVHIDRIVTIEASGIAVAYAASLAMGNLPIVFARKKKSLLTKGEQYTAKIYSYTKEEEYTATISKAYLHAGESVLIIDDFLASGAAAVGLTDIVARQAVLSPVSASSSKRLSRAAAGRWKIKASASNLWPASPVLKITNLSSSNKENHHARPIF